MRGGIWAGAGRLKSVPMAGARPRRSLRRRRSSVTVKDVQVKGNLTPAAVQKALEDELAKLTQCCQDAAKAGLKLPAEITLTFTIGLDGKITGTPKVSLTAPQKSLRNCLAAALKGIQFPQPQAAAVPVTVTLSLTGK